MAQLVVPEKKMMGKYEIRQLLGKGAMGVVYLAYDPDICRSVAIKTLHNDILSDEGGEDFLSRFKSEAKAVGRLMHQNIVAIYDFDLQHSPPYFVMEYCPGVELKKMLLDQRQLDYKQAIKITIQILDALEYSHQMGVIHRDIKPANIFVQENGHVKLADFGIAHMEASDLTRMGMVLGTPSYMSPEQAQAHEIDSRSDLFSTAAVLYEMLTGEKAFKGDNPAITLHQVVHHKPVDVRVLNPSLPEPLNDVLKKALSKKTSQRYECARSFKSALVDLLTIDSTVSRAAYSPFSKVLIGACFALTCMITIGVLVHLKGRFDTGSLTMSGSVVDSSTVYPYTIIPPVQQSKGRVVLDAQERHRVERLLEVAGAHYMVNRLIAPQGSNAYETYLLVLGRDPENKTAVDGLLKVAEAYVEQCDALLREGYIEDVLRRLEAGRTFFPGFPPLMERIQKIEAYSVSE